MTKEEFQFLIDTKKEYEFSYNGKKYNITYGTDEFHCDYIQFGELYTGTRWYSLGELLNEAKVENHYFREMIEIL